VSTPASFASLERAIGVRFRDKDLLAQALTHRSAVRHGGAANHNERIEFLGDAVLELLATEHLYHVSQKPEGELTSWRSALVKGEHLASVAKELKLGDYLFMSRGEEASGGREKPSTLANALEALIGAIYLDQGFEAARSFCDAFILARLEELLAQGMHRDFKSVFQEKAQEFHNVTPHYDVIAEEGPDHDKTFTCAVFIGDERVAQGSGNSKQRAEQAAAKAALDAKGWR
jgi:ribonuclease-3